MNLKILFYLSLSAVCSLAIGQGFNAGILAGVNASQVSGDGYSGFNKAGLLVGIYTNVDISKTLNFQFEINYSQKGARHRDSVSQGTDFFIMRINYIEIPVMLRYNKKKFTYETGLYFGRRVYDYLEDENGPYEIREDLNQLGKTDFGGFIGLNYNFTDNLIMNWRFNSSLIAFKEYNSGASFRFDNGFMHRYISFNFRYQFSGSNEK